MVVEGTKRKSDQITFESLSEAVFFFQQDIISHFKNRIE